MQHTSNRKAKSETYLNLIPVFRKCPHPNVIYDTIDRHLAFKRSSGFIHVAIVFDLKNGKIEGISTNDSYICAERAVISKLHRPNKRRVQKKKYACMLTWRVNKSKNVTSKGKPCRACARAIRKCPWILDVYYVSGGGWIRERASGVNNNLNVSKGCQYGSSYLMSNIHILESSSY